MIGGAVIPNERQTQRAILRMMAQYLAGEAEMGVTAWLRAVQEWPDLPDRVSYNLDEAEKAFRARQRELKLGV